MEKLEEKNIDLSESVSFIDNNQFQKVSYKIY